MFLLLVSLFFRGGGAAVVRCRGERAGSREIVMSIPSVWWFVPVGGMLEVGAEVHVRHPTPTPSVVFFPTAYLKD